MCRRFEEISSLSVLELLKRKKIKVIQLNALNIFTAFCKGMQPVPRAVYCSGCSDEHNFPWWDSKLCPVTLQSGVLPLDRCDLLMFAVHRRSVSSTRENSTDPRRLEFGSTAKSGRNQPNSFNSCAAQDSRTPQRTRQTSAECEPSHLTYRTPQNNSHSGKTR